MHAPGEGADKCSRLAPGPGPRGRNATCPRRVPSPCLRCWCAPQPFVPACLPAWLCRALQAAPSGSMEGDFKFVEGTINQRMGPEWDVICPRFHLQVPDYIY